MDLREGLSLCARRRRTVYRASASVGRVVPKGPFIRENFTNERQGKRANWPRALLRVPKDDCVLTAAEITLFAETLPRWRRTLRLGAAQLAVARQYGKGDAADLYLPQTHLLFGAKADW